MTRDHALLRALAGVAVVVLLATGLVTVAVRVANRSAPAAPAGSAAAPTTPAGPTSTTSPPPAVDADEPAEIRAIRAQVAEIRGLVWKTPLPVKVLPDDEFVRELRAANARDIDPAELAAEGETLKLLHVVPQELDYAELLDDLLSTLVLGFYDPETKEMFVRGSPGEALDPKTRLTIAHEFDHALTDQYFDFGSRLEALDDAGRFEEAAGFVALVEGDARYLDNRWAAMHMTEEEQLEAFLGGSVDPGSLADIPQFLLDSLQFPYDKGKDLVEGRVDAGGYARVDQDYARPPVSTEQVLHPEKYAAGEGWSPPPLPDVAAATGCAPVHHGTLGEFQMSEVLDSELPGDDARRATEGWGGDAFQVVRCGAAVGMVERWQGDDEGAAARLAGALAEWAPGWAGSESGPGGDGWFGGSDGSGRLTRSGARVDLVLASDRATAERMSAGLG